MAALSERCHTCTRRVPEGADCDDAATYTASGWEYRCDDGWTCPSCNHPHPSVVHMEDQGEHRFVLAGVLEARTRNWGIARVFAETLVTIAAEGR